ncbi:MULTISPECIES: LPXTG cell wall anchor domain-containing protein [unclassified Enterococcus]|nr:MULTISPECIES: LPXTG cell wall anchor domain-containing protein [unclassified Enterococcus]
MSSKQIIGESNGKTDILVNTYTNIWTILVILGISIMIVSISIYLSKKKK